MQYNHHPSEPVEAPSAKQIIKAALVAAGRSPAVAKKFGLSVGAINQWVNRGYVPAEHILPLCEMGNYTVWPQSLLEAITRERGRA